MAARDYECPNCGDPAVVLAPGADGVTLASCQGCGRDHGRWADCLSAEAAKTAPKTAAKRPLFAAWFPRGASR